MQIEHRVIPFSLSLSPYIKRVMFAVVVVGGVVFIAEKKIATISVYLWDLNFVEILPHGEHHSCD